MFNGSFVPNGVFSGLKWGLTRKVLVRGLFHTECWGSRCVLSPPFGTHNIELNFIQKLFGDTFAPISAFYGLWLDNLKVFGLSWNMEGKMLMSLLYQTFVGAPQGNLYFNLGCLITNFLLCVCALSDFEWPLATCINKLNTITAKIYKSMVERENLSAIVLIMMNDFYYIKGVLCWCFIHFTCSSHSYQGRGEALCSFTCYDSTQLFDNYLNFTKWEWAMYVMSHSLTLCTHTCLLVRCAGHNTYSKTECKAISKL